MTEGLNGHPKQGIRYCCCTCLRRLDHVPAREVAPTTGALRESVRIASANQREPILTRRGVRDRCRASDGHHPHRCYHRRRRRNRETAAGATCRHGARNSASAALGHWSELARSEGAGRRRGDGFRRRSGVDDSGGRGGRG